jgi:ABC-2 type transport system ATP-binding protein
VLGRRSALEAKDRIGYLPEERGVYRKMRVGDFLSYIAQLKGVSQPQVGPRAGLLLGQLGLEDIQTKRCEDLSKGMLQRVQFVAAIVNEPELLILDEPFGGLDPVSVRLMKNVLADLQRRGTTVLFSTHVMAHAEELCGHIVMIHRGRKVLDEPMAGMRRQFDPGVIRFEPLEESADLLPLRLLPGVAETRPVEGGCEIRLVPGADSAAMMRQIAATVPPARLELARVRLEDVFIRLVAETTDTAAAAHALRANLQGLGTETAAV